MDDKNRPCRVNLIEDTPSDEDAFGPHQRVADAIVELITTEESGKAIGLEGGWGTGKSTVLQLICKRLGKNGTDKESEDLCLVSFDAWAHEGDPLRRTFLETVIKSLRHKEWISDESSKKTLNELANRRKETTTRITPKPTRLGIYFGIAFLLTPMGIALLNTGVKDFSVTNVFFWVGLIFTLAPLIVLICKALQLAKVSQFWKEKRGDQLKKIREAVCESSSMTLLLSKAIEETYSETIETPNPTSIEFEDYFRKAVSEALNHNPKRRLLLIVDNIDRMEQENALAIWSTLQTFLQERHGDDASWFRKIWIIVPFDSIGIRKLWDERVQNINTESQNNPTSEDTANEGNIQKDDPSNTKPTIRKKQFKERTSDSFLDKSFQIRFNVPPPVLSDWKSYLRTLSETALPDLTVEEHHYLYLVYKHWLLEINADSPTPRELKLYVNQIGVVLRQWKYEFAIKYVAYFVLQQRLYISPIEKIKNEVIPSAQDIHLLGYEIIPHVAGLAFNVTSEKGMQLLISGEIDTELATGDPENIMSLKAKYPAGFWPVLEEVVQSGSQGASSATLSSFARALEPLLALDDEDNFEAKNIRRILRGVAIGVDSWKLDEPEASEGVIALCEIQNEPEFAHDFWVVLQRSLKMSEPNETNAITFSKTIFSILEYYDKKSLLNDQTHKLKTPFTADGWIQISGAMEELNIDDKLWSFVECDDAASIPKAIVSAINSNDINDTHLRAIHTTFAAKLDVNWSGVVAAIETKLNANTDGDNSQALILLKCIRKLKKQENNKAIIACKSLVTGGHVLHYLRKAALENNNALKLVCLSFQIAEADGLTKPPQVGQSWHGFDELIVILRSTDNEIADHMITILSQDNNLEKLFTFVNEQEKIDPLIQLCLKNLAESDEPQRLFSARVITEHWKLLSSLSESGVLSNLLKRLMDDNELCEQIVSTQTFSKNDVGLYGRILLCSKDVDREFLDWCSQGLEGITEEDWQDDLSSQCENVDLAVNLAKHGAKPRLTSSLTNALEKHAKLLIKGEAQPSDKICTEWDKLISVVDEDIRYEFLGRILAEALSKDGDIEEPFFLFYGSVLSNTELLLNQENLVSHLFSPLIMKHNKAGLVWLDSLFQNTPEIVTKVKNIDNFRAFETRIKDAMKNPKEDDVQNVIESLATHLGIIVDSPKSTSESDTTSDNDTNI